MTSVLHLSHLVILSYFFLAAVVGAACASSKANTGDAAAPTDPGVAPEAGVGGASASGPSRFFASREEAEAAAEEEEDVGQGLASDMDEVVGEDSEVSSFRKKGCKIGGHVFDQNDIKEHTAV